jgi:predicted kinase
MKKQPRAIVLVGIQGVGKSTYCKKLESEDPTVKRVTRDDIRFMLFDTNRYAEIFEEVHDKFGHVLDSIYKMTVDTILQQGLTVLLDETHHRKADRKKTLKYLRETYPGIKVEVHYLYSDFERCYERNMGRRPEQRVPRAIVRRFHQELVAGFGGSASPWKAGAKLGWEHFDVVHCIDACKYLKN